MANFLLKNTRFYVLLFASIACTIAPAHADDLVDGIKAYERSDFGTSIQFLSAYTRGSGSKNAKAYYYLANAYVQLNNNSAALIEYGKCLKLAPQAETAALCKTAILRLTATGDLSGALGGSSSAISGSSAKITAVGSGSSARTEHMPVKGVNDSRTGNASTATIDPQVKSVSAAEEAPIRFVGLPSIPTFPKDDGPTLAEVTSWPNGQQANYIQTARDRKAEALSKQERMRETMKRAQSVASSMVPSVRQFGETDELMKARMERGRTQINAALKPFDDASTERQKEVDEMNSIYQACRAAALRVAGYPN